MDILILLFTTITVLTIIISIFTTKQIDILNSLLVITLNILLFRFKEIEWLKILLICLLGLNTLFTIFIFVLNYSAYDLRKQVLFNYMKENELDFFIQTDHKDRIINYSKTIFKNSNITKKEIYKHTLWKFIFDFFSIVSINKEEYNLEVGSKFLTSYKLANSKHKKYRFELLVKHEDEYINYIGIIEPIVFNNHLIGRNVYIYQDRLEIIENLKTALQTACTELEKSKDQSYILMSLSNEVVLYYDYQSKTYIATESFCRFTHTKQKEYKFREIYSMIHPDDVNLYSEQARNVNSLMVTKIKYRLNINNEYYNVIEDSINVVKDAGLVSIIRIIGKATDKLDKDAPLSTEEANSLINNLNNTNITKVIDDVEDIMNAVIGEETNEEN